MADYKREIDGDELFKRIAGHSYYLGDDILTRISLMQEGKLPKKKDVRPADVVEVVRCKDCVHRPIVQDASMRYGFGITGPEENGDTDFTCPYLCSDPYYNRMPKDDWYCSSGKKRAVNG